MQDTNRLAYESALATVAEADEAREHRQLTLVEAAEAARAWVEVQEAEAPEKVRARERYDRKKASKARFWHQRTGR